MVERPAFHEAIASLDPALAENRAVVLGFGMGGLAAAAALREQYGEVVVVDKDPAPTTAEQRDGVPQANQLHNLLAGGQSGMEELLPGYLDELHAIGAGSARVARDIHVKAADIDISYAADFGFQWVSARRPALELAAVRRLEADAQNVMLVGSAQAEGLVVSDNNVRGVRISADGDDATIDAALVVDATGRSFQARSWLGDASAEVPALESVESAVNQRFASMSLERPDGHERDQFWMTLPSVLTGMCGVVIAPVDKGRWQVSANRRGAGDMPQNYAEFMEFAARVGGADRTIADLLMDARPLNSEDNSFSVRSIRTANYGGLKNPLVGFLPIGDSIMNLNPLAGQGMTVAIWQARLMRALKERHGDDTQSLTSEYIQYASGLPHEAHAAAGGLVHLSAMQAQEAARTIADNEELYRATMEQTHMVRPKAVQAVLGV